MCRDRRCVAAVVGGGPAGLTAVGGILPLIPVGLPIYWCDPEGFGPGRLAIYREVPSNTPVELFFSWAAMIPALEALLPQCPTVEILRARPQNQGCELGLIADLCEELATALIARHANVIASKVRVDAVDFNTSRGTWSLRASAADHDGVVVDEVRLLFFATGSTPAELPAIPFAEGGRIPLDLALCPSKNPLPAGACLALVGSSHSAVLVAREAVRRNCRVLWFMNKDLLYAYKHQDGWTKYDNTGLKGEAATWARENLEQLLAERRLIIERVKDSGLPDFERLQLCTHLVQAVGFRRVEPPRVSVDGAPATGLTIDPASSIMEAAASGTIFGMGIGFAPLVVDPEGRAEFAVGLVKFSKHFLSITENVKNMFC